MLDRLNIRNKLALVLWGSALLAFGLAGLGAALYQSLTLERRARQLMEPYVQLVVVGTDAAVAFEDPVRAQEILDTLTANPETLEAEIVLEDGRVLARYSRDVNLKALPSPERRQTISFGADRVKLSQRLPHGAQLHFSVSLAGLREQLHQTLWLFGAGGLVLLAVTLGLLAALQRTIIRPIATLATAAEQARISADYSCRVPAAGADEIAQLGRSFNAMMAAVRDREDDLHQLSLFQRTLLDHAAYGIISTTPDGIVTSYNPAAEGLTGYPAGEVVDRATPLLWHDPAEVAQRARELSETLGATIAPGFEVFAARARRHLADENEWTFVRKDGTRLPVLLSVTALRDDQGQITGFVGLVNDLSERHQAAEDLAKSEARFRRLAENARDVIYRMTLPEGVYEYVSPAASELFGYVPEEFYATPQLLRKIVHPDGQADFEAQWQQLLKGETPPAYNFQIVHKSGEMRWMNQRNILIRNGNGQPTALEAIVTDITPSKRSEEELRRFNAELEQRVQERTGELKAKNAELEKVNKIFIGRELKMVELKKRIKELEQGQ